MEGCREEKKKFCGFEQRLALKKTYTRILMGENLQQMQYFSRQKTVYISINTRLDSRAQTFFSFGQPSIHKKIRKIFHQKSQLFLTLSKTKTITKTNKQIPFFPADGLSFVYANYKLLSKAHSVSNRKLAFAFSS